MQVRHLLGSRRLTQKLQGTPRDAFVGDTRRQFIASDDGEYFLLPEGRLPAWQAARHPPVAGPP